MNAIILAAGMGQRMRPLTNDRPKCLVEVLGAPLVERQIRFLQERGITDITLVTGYKAERLDYLRERYQVKLVHNPRYEDCNNIYSLYLMLDNFSDTLIIEGDVYIEQNFFPQERPECSTYYAAWRKDYEREWGLQVDDLLFVERIIPGSGTGYILSGVSYWTAHDAAVIAQELRQLVEGGTEEYSQLFWDDVVLRQFAELKIQVRPCPDLTELDTPEELAALEQRLRAEGKA